MVEDNVSTQYKAQKCFGGDDPICNKIAQRQKLQLFTALLHCDNQTGMSNTESMFSV